MNEKFLTNVLTVILAIVLIGMTYLFIEPGFTKEDMTIADIPVYHTEAGEPVVIDITFTPSGRRSDSITELMENIKKENVASKESYTYSPDSVDAVHVCINMAVDQAMWINKTYGYDTGIVMLRSKYLGGDHAQTWITINGTTYIIESTSNKWWTVADHKRVWGDDYKFEFVSVKKGLEFEKENNEALNTKDVERTSAFVELENELKPEPTSTPINPINYSAPEYIRQRTGSYIYSNMEGNFHIVEWHNDSRIIFETVSTRYGGWRAGTSLHQIDYIKIFIDDQLIASFKPTIIKNPNGGHDIMQNSVIIELPDGLNNSGEIRTIGSFINLNLDETLKFPLQDGEYTMHTHIQRTSKRWHYNYRYLDDYPVYQAIYRGN